jgi:hypothetical protein
MCPAITKGKTMSNDEIALSKFVVNKVWEVAQTCVDENRKGWFVTMPEFRDAMDSLDFTSEEVGAALAYLELRTCLLAFRNEEGHITGISLIPQRYQCDFCGMWLNTRDDPENHIELCLKQQNKIERNRMLLRE